LCFDDCCIVSSGSSITPTLPEDKPYTAADVKAFFVRESEAYYAAHEPQNAAKTSSPAGSKASGRRRK
jgi:hypothetical protein